MCKKKQIYSAATPTGSVGRKLTNSDANWEQKIAKFFCKQPITLKQADNARSKKFDTVIMTARETVMSTIGSFQS